MSFAAILPRVSSIDDASAVARKLLLSMQEPFLVRGHLISIGISIGIALYPQHGEDIDTLMQRADAAMYFAKKQPVRAGIPRHHAAGRTDLATVEETAMADAAERSRAVLTGVLPGAREKSARRPAETAFAAVARCRITNRAPLRPARSHPPHPESAARQCGSVSAEKS